MNLIEKLEQENMKETLPEMNVGDTVRVHVKIKEGSRERIQVFEGTIIAKKHGGVEQTITVRRLSYGVGVEKVFQFIPPILSMLKRFVVARFAEQNCIIFRNRVGKAC